MNPYLYTFTELNKEARRLAKKEGRYVSHALRIHDRGCSLVVFYVPREDPHYATPNPPESAIFDTSQAL